MTDEYESRVSLVLAAIGRVQVAFERKVAELEQAGAATGTGWVLRLGESKPPDELSGAERNELVTSSGVMPGLFIWGYVDAIIPGRGGVAWHLDVRRNRADGWMIDRMVTLDDSGRALPGAACSDSVDLARTLPKLAADLLAEEP